MNKNIKDMIEYPREGILSKEIIKDERMDVTLFCMADNSEMSEHTSTKQGLIYILEGNGIFNLEGKDIKMLPGVFIHMRKDMVHALKTKENTSFILILIK